MSKFPELHTLPTYTSHTGIHYPITPEGTAIPGIISGETSIEWQKVQQRLKELVRMHLGDDFCGEVFIKYITPGSRSGSTGIICYATPNGVAGYNVSVILAKTIH